jgi:hypothetical protein
MLSRKMKKGFLALVFAFILIVFIGSAGTGCSFDNEEEFYASTGCDTTAVTYSGSVAPILGQACTSCHSPDGGTPPNLNNYAEIKNYIDQSPNEISARINFVDGVAPMPQGGNKLPLCDIRKIELWIAGGYPNN